MLDLAQIMTLVVGSAAVGVSFYAAVNSQRAFKQSAANAKTSAAILAKANEVEAAVNGRLTLLIASIQAHAESESAAARSDAFLRESRAFTAGQEDVRSLPAPATAVAVAEVRETLINAVAAMIDAFSATHPKAPLPLIARPT